MLRAACGVLVFLTANACVGTHAAAPLRVCADPNNLPFSNERGEGIENALAAMLGRELGTSVEYTWFRQGRGFVRNTLDAGKCDVLMGVPTRYELALTTRAYYRSSYVFVSRRGENPGLTSLDDPRLGTLRVGVQLVGDDFANSPPAHALSARGLVRNIKGYSVLGDYSRPNPPARIVDAVATGEVDTALVWGPLAGYFAARSRVPLDVTPVDRPDDGATRPLAFDISMGVRRGDTARRQMLDDFIVRRRPAIDDLLDRYAVPRPRSIPRGES